MLFVCLPVVGSIRDITSCVCDVFAFAVAAAQAMTNGDALQQAYSGVQQYAGIGAVKLSSSLIRLRLRVRTARVRWRV